MNAPLSEKKYQAIKLYNSGFISLTDIKAMFRILSVVTDEPYSTKTEQEDVLRTEYLLGKIERLAMTRDAAKQRAILRFSRPTPPINRAEAISAFVTRFDGARTWERFGPLIARSGRKSEPRPGSSKGKIAKTRYIGFDKANRCFEELFLALEQLLASSEKQKATLVAQKSAIVKATTRVTAQRSE